MNESQQRQIWRLRHEGVGYGTIAKTINLSRDTVKKYCGRHPELKGLGSLVKENLDEGCGIYCKTCHQVLLHHSTGRPKKFCSAKCRKVHWDTHRDQHDKTKISYDELTCQNCGRSFLSYANPSRKFCSHTCYIQSRFYKGETNDKSTNNGN